MCRLIQIAFLVMQMAIFGAAGDPSQNSDFFPPSSSVFCPEFGASRGSNLISTNNFGSNVPQNAQPQEPSQQGCAMPPSSCPKSRYRSFNGSCNNLKHPVLGMPVTPYTRFLPSKYADGVYTPTVALSGKPLPIPRNISLTLYPDVHIEDPKLTLAAMQYGQIITHDMSLLLGNTIAQPDPTKCCTDDGQFLESSKMPEHCFPLVIPDDDPVHSLAGTKCMNFIRTINTHDRGCVSKHEPAEQLTSVTHFLDLSLVYGNTEQLSHQLRQFKGGRLLVDVREGRQWPPRNSNASSVCTGQSLQESCYLAGDTRVNQNLQLTLLQIILLREHNRIADTLAKLNPHWNDETLFQEARRIAIAQHQYISYYEWLPNFIGLENSLHSKILYKTKDFVNDYDEGVNPTVLNEHATAAFRFFHSLIAGKLNLVTEYYRSYGNIRLSDWMNGVAIIEQGNNFDELTRGLGTQSELRSDQYHDTEITNFLFKGNQTFGLDLKAIDIQRNRDHGLSSYNDYRHFCGLPKANSFEDLLDVISKENVQKLASLYESVDDIDLTVGGSLERLVPGTLAGPTFLSILTEQFYRTRAGDRFWFENGGHDGFTLEQLNEIRKSSISRLFCDNGDNIKTMQPRGFKRISRKNSVRLCKDLRAVDLSLWKD